MRSRGLGTLPIGSVGIVKADPQKIIAQQLRRQAAFCPSPRRCSRVNTSVHMRTRAGTSSSERKSEIVRHVLPHDALELVFHDRSGHVTLEARSTGDLTGAFGCSVNDDQAFYIMNDLRRPSSRVTCGAPSSAVDTLLAAGYRSVLN